MANSQIPLHFEIVGRDGKVNQPWAFWFNNITASLPPPGAGNVIDGSNTTYGQMTLFQGPDINKGSSPSLGWIYFATDTGKIYVENAGAWVLELPAFTGDVTKPLHSTVLTLNTVNAAVGTFGDQYNYPVITVNEKGLVTNVSLEPSTAGGGPGGTSFSVQYNDGGIFGGEPEFIYNPVSNTLSVTNITVGGTISYLNRVPNQNNLLPIQTGLAGQVLTTNGTNVAWGPTGTFEMIFNFGDATPKNLMIIPADKIIQDVSIILMTAFDATSTLSIGDVGNVNRLLSTTDNTTLEAGTYTTEPAYKYAVNTQLTLSITPGATTQGNGLVVITYQK